MRKTLLVIISSILLLPAYGQWQQLDGLEGGNVLEVVALGSGTHLAATTYGGVYKSTDDGQNWALISGSPIGTEIRALAAVYNGNTALLATEEGIYKSTDDGVTWTLSNSGLVSTDITHLLAVSGQVFFAVAGDLVYKTTDDGATWVEKSTGIEEGAVINDLALDLFSTGQILAVATDEGLFKTEDGGDDWSQQTVTGPAAQDFTLVEFAHKSEDFEIHMELAVFDGNEVYMYYSEDFGDNYAWGTLSGLEGLQVNNFDFWSGGPPWVLVMTDDGMYTYTFVGDFEWELFLDKPANANTVGLSIASPSVYLFSTGSLYQLASDWTEANSGILAHEITALLEMDGAIYAGTNGGGVFVSDDAGETWSASNSGIAAKDLSVLALYDNNGTLLAGTTTGVYQSANDGATWTKTSTGLSGFPVSGIVKAGANLFALETFSGISKSTDGGNTWTSANTGLDGAPLALGTDGTNLYAGSFFGSAVVFRSTDGGANWTAADTDITNSGFNAATTFYSNGDGTFAGTGEGLFFTDDGGDSWTEKGTLPGTAVSFAKEGGLLYASVDGEGVYSSEDDGDSFSAFSQDLTNLNTTKLLFADGVLFSGTKGSGMWMYVEPTEPTIPEPISIGNVTSESIQVRWSPSGANGSPLIEYVLEQKVGSGEFAPVYSGLDVSYTATGLIAETKYYYRVKAVNGIGSSDYTPEIMSTPQDAGDKILMANGTITTCETTFHSDYNLANGSNFLTSGQPTVLTFKPDTPDGKITVVFGGNFSTRTSPEVDRLYIFDGPTPHLELAELYGFANPTDYTSTSEGGELTFSFAPNAAVHYNQSTGWFADIVCTTIAKPAQPTFSDATPTSVQVNWTAAVPYDETKPVTAYVLEQRRQNSNEYDVIYSGPDLFFQVDELVAGNTYHFRLKAINSTGKSLYNSSSITIKDVPGQANVTFCPINETSFKVSWSALPRGAAITSYTVEQKAGTDGTYEPIAGLAADATTYLVAGADNTKEYFYRVKATNSEGTAAEWGEASFTPMVGAVPTGLSLSRGTLSLAEIQIQWSGASSSCSAITGYVVEEKTGDDGTYEEVYSGPNTSYSKTSGIVAREKYYFRVKAVNGSGGSEWAELWAFGGTHYGQSSATTCEGVLGSYESNLANFALTTITSDDPGKVVTLDFKYIELSDVGTPRIHLTSSDKSIVPVNTQTNSSYYIINGSGYERNGDTFFVAENDISLEQNVDVGPNRYLRYVALIGCATPVTPDQPAPPVADDITVTSIDLSWSSPEDHGLPVYDYVLEKKTGAEGTFTAVDLGANLTTEFTDTNLSPGTDYYYRLAAKSGGGTSVYSDEVMYSTIITAPEMPEFVSGGTSTNDYQLTWEVPYDNGSPILSYILDQKVGDGEYVEVYNGPGDQVTGQFGAVIPNQRSAKIEGLSESGNYSYRLKARNAIGDSEYDYFTNACPHIQWYADLDNDGYVNQTSLVEDCIAPEGYKINTIGFDCDDTDENITAQTLWYYDADGDGYGAGEGSLSCTKPQNYVDKDGDCNNSDAKINPETVWFTDEDGDGYFGTVSDFVQCASPGDGYGYESTDCDDTDESIYPGIVWYMDSDGDGYGNNTTATIIACEKPDGYVLNNTDCNDGQPEVNPETVWYFDADGDGFGNPSEETTACTQPTSYVANSTDCNDSDPLVHPETLWYADTDGDGYGDPQSFTQACEQPTGFVSNSTDCDDTDAAATPNTVWYFDSDGDGFGVDDDQVVIACQRPSDDYSDKAGDCDNFNQNVYPGAPGLPDGLDNNCDGAVDKAPQSIIFETIQDVPFADDTSVTLVAFSDAAQSITYEIVGEGATLEQGTLTLTQPGSFTVTASQPGNEFYEAAEPISQTFCVLPPNVEFDAVLNANPPKLVASTTFPDAIYHWYLNDALIAEGGPELEISEDGAYSLQVSVDECTGPLHIMDVTLPEVVETGLSDLTESSISVYPNPAHHKITIEIDNSSLEEVNVRLLAIDGTVVQTLRQSKTSEKCEISLDLTKVPAGLFFVQVSQGDTYRIQKLIRE
ncbi:MAG: fibronectin type III domain-containing protein [Imperialibacter sp.]|uniref:fibronectin type III domain-containing protein n=1 Tax=Imperialibacter sp. TaxID=2038411 RepID=UPI0032EFD269